MNELMNRLKTFQADRIDNEEMFELSMFARALFVEYEAHNVQPPDWLQDSFTSIGKLIQERRRDMLSARLKDIQAKKAALKTREQKVADLSEEEARLRTELGV